MGHHRYINKAGLGLVLVTLAVPIAPARAADPAAGSASRTVPADCSKPVRSLPPEDAAARRWRCDGAIATSSLAGTTGADDMRSPDARDAARLAESPRRSAPPAAEPVAQVAASSPAVAADDTNGDTTAAIVAGGVAGMLLLGAAWVLTSRRRDAAMRDRTLVSH